MAENINAEQLKSFISRVERQEEEMSALRADMREIFKEAKDYGYDPKIMRVIIRLKKMDEADRNELDELTETYRAALGV